MINSKNNFNHQSLLKEEIKKFPEQSGVYLMINNLDKIIYIGKAKNLRNRVRSYFSDSKGHSTKTKYLVQSIFRIEYLLTKTEVEAFLLEASLIKKHRPRYNIRLRDDKSYPYIKISLQDEYPRLYLSRRVKKDGSVYFGPYTSSSLVFSTIRFLNRTFKIRDCTDSVLKTRKRPCMTYQIGRCTAPCVQFISSKDYKDDVDSAYSFLKGQDKNVVKSLTKKMMLAADEEKFEVAAKIRDAISAIKSILERQSVVSTDEELDQDAIGYFGDDRGCLIQMIHIRGGRVIGMRSHILPQIDLKNEELHDPRDWLTDFINQYYEDNFIPDELILPVDLGLDLIRLIEAVLKSRKDSAVRVRLAVDKYSHEIIEMANKNAESQFLKYVSKSEAKIKGLDQIKIKFGLSERPNRIECFDISTFHGAETVASQVVFEEGIPQKDHYRRYKVKTVQGTDDFASLYEVLKRRFNHKEWELPDLLMVDGGKGQLNQAVRVLKELGYSHIPVVSIAKARTKSEFQKSDIERTQERFFRPGQQNYITFPTNSESLQILVNLRDEAHRFAISYHRKLREEASLESEYDNNSKK